jgi:hypothetical protein
MRSMSNLSGTGADAARATQRAEPQCARAVVMIRPVRFVSNPQTAVTNRFQQIDAAPSEDVAQARALAEFESLVGALTDAGVEVVAFDDTPEPHTPDSIFPNNWVSFHADGTVVLYPMQAENRRAERRLDIIEHGLRDAGYAVREIVDLSPYEREGRYLEGTGSLILDRVNRIAYACLSPRTDASLVAEFGRRLGYRPETFTATGADGHAVYHTNVIMSVGDGLAVFCADMVTERARADAIVGLLRETGHDVVLLDHEQIMRFAGNCLELENARGERVLAMSAQGAAALTGAQRDTIERHARIVTAPIGNIELCAGGSVRCMLAELHLPRLK